MTRGEEEEEEEKKEKVEGGIYVYSKYENKMIICRLNNKDSNCNDSPLATWKIAQESNHLVDYWLAKNISSSKSFHSVDIYCRY